MSKKNRISRGASAPLSHISDADKALFTPEELAKLEEEVVVELSEEMKAEARDRVREQMKARKRLEMQQAVDPNEETKVITVDLAPFAADIRLDNVVYLHGTTYQVPSRVYETMRDIMARTWKHEHQRGNPTENFYQRQRSSQIGPQDVGAPTSQLLMRV